MKEETKSKISHTLKEKYQKGYINPMKGRKGKVPKNVFKKGCKPWNKGLTKKNDNRVLKSAINSSIAHKSKKWSSKRREAEKYIKRTRVYIRKDRSKFLNYCLDVNNISRKFYNELFNSWNGYCKYCNRYIRNEKEKYKPSIDHKVSKKIGFVNNLSSEIIGNKINLVVCCKLCNSLKQVKMTYDGSLTVNKNDFGFY